MSEESVQQEERIDPIELFSPKIREAVTGLMYLGYISRTVKFAGHTFVMETIRPYQKFALGQAIEPWRNTLLQPQLWAAIHVALSLTSIDGKRDFCPPISENAVEFALARLEWLTDKSGWWQPVIDYLFAEYVKMELDAQKAINEFDFLVKANRASSSPSPGSLSDKESSTDEILSAVQPWADSSMLSSDS